jgi:hypothetical protein
MKPRHVGGRVADLDSKYAESSDLNASIVHCDSAIVRPLEVVSWSRLCHRKACNNICGSSSEAIQHRSGKMAEVLPIHGFCRQVPGQIPSYRERGEAAGAVTTCRWETARRERAAAYVAVVPGAVMHMGHVAVAVAAT